MNERMSFDKLSPKAKITLRIGAAAMMIGGTNACTRVDETPPTPVSTSTSILSGEQQEVPAPYTLPESNVSENEPLSIHERIASVEGNYDAMQQLAATNQALYSEGEPQKLGLAAVRVTIEQLYPEMEGKLRVGSAYKAKEVLEAESDLFAEIALTTREESSELPVGTILVFQPNFDSSHKSDLVNGVHHGTISIIVDKDEPTGTVILGSDHQRELLVELDSMQNGLTAFVPIASIPETPLHTPNPEATMRSLPTEISEVNLEIEDPLTELIDRDRQAALAAAAYQEAIEMNDYYRCLEGVQNAINDAGIYSLPRMPAARQMIDILRYSPDFVEIEIARDDIPELNPGNIVVYDGDPTSSGDDVYDNYGNYYPDNGHIEISLGNGDFASDHINYDQGLILNSPVYVFAPRKS